VPVEVARLISAVTSTDERLAVLSARLESEHLHEGHLLLEAHRMMLRDDEIVGGTRRLIESDEIAAEGAVRRVIDAIAAKFGRMEDPYLRERRADIEAIGDRLLRTLLGLPEVSTDTSLAPGTIGVGSILSPIDALHLPRSGMVGFAAERGGKTSHASIILRALEIPFVVGVRGLRSAVHPGDRLVVDGSLGEVIVNPDDDAIKLYEERRDRERSRLQALKSRGTGPVATSEERSCPWRRRCREARIRASACAPSASLSCARTFSGHSSGLSTAPRRRAHCESCSHWCPGSRSSTRRSGCAPRPPRSSRARVWPSIATSRSES
ncbi:MAG: hypothetical protein E6J84_14035, partial [Deltaproteobacteria bacterium]